MMHFQIELFSISETNINGLLVTRSWLAWLMSHGSSVVAQGARLVAQGYGSWLRKYFGARGLGLGGWPRQFSFLSHET